MRGLTADSIDTTSDLPARIHAVLDRRLNTGAATPVAMAVSGGGDSVALALIAAEWARRHGRPLLILTVDHGLNPASPGWTEQCARLADRLGARFQPLAWTGEKPGTGLPAAARTARHRLLADAARAAGARAILMGHTADDLAEAAAMRAAGSTTPDPREWAASPVWPEGRGLFLLRPMLDLRRRALRGWLAERAEAWIEDPANDNPRFARSRARIALAGASPSRAAGAMPPDLARLARQVREGPDLILSRPALRDTAFEAARALVGAACLCVAGTSRPPRRDRLDRLTQTLRGQESLVATLGGARVEADAGTIRWLREAGEIARSGSGDLVLNPGETGVWDGRFEITATHPLVVRALAGRAARLSPAARAALAAWPAAARGGLPAVIGDDVACPVVEDVEGVSLRSLVVDRLHAACGAVVREPL
jgi:tRNA(Ile)-lysidine synthase